MIMGNSIEKTGKFYYSDKNPIMDDSLLIGNASKRLKDEKEFKEISEKKVELAKLKQEEILAKVATLELVPWGNRVLILKYPENPYKQIISKGGIFIPDNINFKNPESGEADKLEEGIVCGKVIEVGPDCKQVLPGDDVFYQLNTTYPIPFMGMGYTQTSEPQLLTIIAEGLKKRFNME